MIPYEKRNPFWQTYRFVNSIAMFSMDDTVYQYALNYEYLLRTDCDVMLTPWLHGLKTNRMIIGTGGYMTKDVQDNLHRIVQQLNLTDNMINHIGASWYGPASSMQTILHWSFFIMTHILIEFGANLGQWPGWWRGVSSMYGAHIAFNHFVSPFTVVQGLLDNMCHGTDEMDFTTLLIHAWHTEDWFSKHAFHKGTYDPIQIPASPPTDLRSYCIWVALKTYHVLPWIQAAAAITRSPN